VRDENFEEVKKSIDAKKEQIRNAFGFRKNRYEDLKKANTKNGIINMDRLILKVVALSLSPTGKNSIKDLSK